MRRIRVFTNYGGVLTNHERILPGVHDADSPGLHGCPAEYLVDNGHAEWVDAVEQVEVTPMPGIADILRASLPEALAEVRKRANEEIAQENTDDDDDPELHVKSMLKPELVDLAESKGIDTEGLTVKQLIDAIEEEGD